LIYRAKFYFYREDKEVFSIIMSDDEGREELKKSLADKLDVSFWGGDIFRRGA
jgi:hypothetical protein